MAHEWHQGVLASSSWHKCERVGVMANAAEMICAGESSGAWPVALASEPMITTSGLSSNKLGVVGTYLDGHKACIGVVGSVFEATKCESWRELIVAAVEAGARPTGAFSLRGGSRMVATFEVGESNGLKTFLIIADAFDGSMKLTVGFTTVRVVCANTLAVSLRADGKGMARLGHNSTLEEKVKILRASIGEAVTKSQTIRATYEAAERAALSPAKAEEIFDKLFPLAPEGDTIGTKVARTMSETARAEAVKAMQNPVNNVGGTLATLWNAATYLVDRTGEGEARKTRTDAIDAILFGARAKRVQEIQTLIEVIMADGTVQTMSAPQAVEVGVDQAIVAKRLLDDMLDDAAPN